MPEGLIHAYIEAFSDSWRPRDAIDLRMPDSKNHRSALSFAKAREGEANVDQQDIHRSTFVGRRMRVFFNCLRGRRAASGA